MHHNPVYGTARVCVYLIDAAKSLNWNESLVAHLETMIAMAQQYLASVQNSDGSWGGDADIEGTIEETSLVVAALKGSSFNSNVDKGLVWLDQQYSTSGLRASPIGLYFASLWYDEKLYPITMYLEALE